MQWIAPSRVVDLGCGRGTWLKVFAEQGGQDICGVDGPWMDPDQLEIPRDCFVAHDLSAAAPPVEGPYDLAVSLEVAEHLPPPAATRFVDTLTALAPVVLFSAAIPGQGGVEHQNEQWPAYWADRFASKGYTAVDVLRPRIWMDDQVEWWYAQNAMLYVAHDRLDAYALPEPTQVGLSRSRVHPDGVAHRRVQKAEQDRHVAHLEREVDRLQARVEELAAWGRRLDQELQAARRLTPGTVSMTRVLKALPRLVVRALKKRFLSPVRDAESVN